MYNMELIVVKIEEPSSPASSTAEIPPDYGNTEDLDLKVEITNSSQPTPHNRFIKFTLKSSSAKNSNSTSPYHHATICPICSKSFGSPTSLKVHMTVTHNPASNSSTICELCDKAFRNPSLLKLHFRRNHPAKDELREARLLRDKLRKREARAKAKATKAAADDATTTSAACDGEIETEWKNQERKHNKVKAKSNGDLKVKPNKIRAPKRINLICLLCKQQFNSSLQLKDHESTVHADETQCPYCNKINRRSLYYLKRHIMYSHNMRHTSKPSRSKIWYQKVYCDKCGNCYKNQEILSKHQAAMHVPIPKESLLSCATCGADFKNRTGLIYHQRTHEPDTGIRFHCAACPSKFRWEDALKAHVKREHSQTGPIHLLCPTCGKSFNKRINYQHHLKIHVDKDARQWVCQFCDSSFDQDLKRRKHEMKWHSDSNGKFPCAECNNVAAFKTPSALERHTRLNHPHKVKNKVEFVRKKWNNNDEFQSECLLKKLLTGGDNLKEQVKHQDRGNNSQVLGVINNEPLPLPLVVVKPPELFWQDSSSSEPIDTNHVDEDFDEPSSLMDNNDVVAEDDWFKLDFDNYNNNNNNEQDVDDVREVNLAPPALLSTSTTTKPITHVSGVCQVFYTTDAGATTEPEPLKKEPESATNVQKPEAPPQDPKLYTLTPKVKCIQFIPIEDRAGKIYCEHCCINFNQSQHLSGHMKLVHGIQHVASKKKHQRPVSKKSEESQVQELSKSSSVLFDDAPELPTVEKPNKSPTKQITKDRKITCSICGKLISADNMKTHVQRMHGSTSNSIPCPNCHKTFHTYTNLSRHIRSMHTYQDSATCSICGRKFRNFLNLNDHVSKAHPPAGKKFPCPIPGCNSVLRNGPCLRQHLRTVHGKNTAGIDVAKPAKFLCDQCPYTAKNKYTLQIHIAKVHDGGVSGGGGQVCNTCGKTFKNAYCLRAHETGHSSVSKFQCLFCSATFNRSIRKRKHELTNHKEQQIGPDKSYRCRGCNVGCSTSSRLEQHVINVHSKEELQKLYYGPAKSIEPPRAHVVNSRVLDPDDLILKDNKPRAATATPESSSPNLNSKSYYSVPVKCNICGQLCKNKSCKIKHVNLTHPETLRRNCGDCGEEFANSKQLSRHRLRHHAAVAAESSMKTCPVCGLITSRRLYGKHFETHGLPWTCEFCGKEFKDSSRLKDHRRIHNKNK